MDLSRLTTIRLGGKADYLFSIQSREDVFRALEFCKQKNLPYYILGGGSNTIAPDEGFSGVLLKMENATLEFHEKEHPNSVPEEEKEKCVTLTAGAGMLWDDLVVQTIERGLVGLESLSGIPGSVGATPVQNVGAYGTEVSDSMLRLVAFDLHLGDFVVLENNECEFSYRNSRFKQKDRNRYIIFEITFQLDLKRDPVINYPELEKQIANTVSGASTAEKAMEVRKAVLELRRKKGMVVDPNDPWSVSAGSFFTNPLLNESSFQQFMERFMGMKGIEPDEVPSFDAPGGKKIPAAWLVEQAGFPRGYRRNGICVSEKHSLALVNCGGNTRNLLELEAMIREAVQNRFGLDLEREPVFLNEAISAKGFG